jgi:hypothetical protein
MLQKKVFLSTAQISQEVSYFTMGFARLTVKNGVENAECAGSGTFVTIGSVHGILTAAHVVDHLPKEGPVGIITHVEDPTRFAKQRIAMEHCQSEVIRAAAFDEKGPDLAFLRLPQQSVGWIAAKSSFYNLKKYRSDVLANKDPSPSEVHALTGIIHELTEDVPGSDPRARRKSFTAIFCGARLAALRYLNTHDLNYFKLTSDPGFALPKSFEGTSGGSAWRFYVTEKDGGIAVIERRLVGVPFYQALDTDGKRIITCHGPKGIYGALIDAVSTRWPEEAAA